MSTQKKNVDATDYLTEDQPLPNQKFMCISFLKPSNIDDKSKVGNLTVSGVKVRGCYETLEEAKARADFLQRCDQYHNIYIGEVGKWCPFEDNPEKAKDSEYMNKDLNKLMKTYMKQQTEAKDYHEIRKQEMMNQAFDEAARKKKLNKKNKKKEKKRLLQELNNAINNNNSGVSVVPESEVVKATEVEEDEDDDVEEGVATAKVKTKLKTKEEIIKSQKSELDADKEKLDREKKEINENINKLRSLEQELLEKMKELPDEEVKKMMGLGRVN